ncbi:MAG: ribokinase [Baekduia sp.]|nr:ribokinase [Baekduia sp.]
MFVAGTVNADFVFGVQEPPERGASLVARRLLRTSGGRAGNVAVMARRLGARARLFGCVGADELAQQALAGPRAAGADVTAVRRVPAGTGVVAILVAGGTKTMVLAPGANDAFSEADGERLAADLHAAGGGSVLVVDNEVSSASLTTALEAARECGRATVLDPTRPERATERLLHVADHVTPNADEAARMTGVDVASPRDAERAGRRLLERGARHAHVRLPHGGCVTVRPDGQALAVAPPSDLPVVDTTGAGDAFAGTLATAIMARRPLVEAVRLAVAAAAFAVTGFGAQESYPEARALEALGRRVRTECR